MEIKDLIKIPLLKGSVFNWNEKKKEIIPFIYDIEMKRYPNFISSREVECNSFKKSFVEIFKEELTNISNSIEADFEVKDVWVVLYEKGQEQYIHNHNNEGLSGIIYLDFDKEEHDSTKYFLPFNNWYNNKSLIVSENVKEGDIVVTPSFINHFVPYNKSDKIRSIIGFDLNFKKGE